MGASLLQRFPQSLLLSLRLLTNLVAEHVALIAQSVSIEMLNCSYFFVSSEQLWVNHHVGGLKWTWWGQMHIHRLYFLYMRVWLTSPTKITVDKTQHFVNTCMHLLYILEWVASVGIKSFLLARLKLCSTHWVTVPLSIEQKGLHDFNSPKLS